MERNVRESKGANSRKACRTNDEDFSLNSQRVLSLVSCKRHEKHVTNNVLSTRSFKNITTAPVKKHLVSRTSGSYEMS
jgi:hypothetical protein